MTTTIPDKPRLPQVPPGFFDEIAAQLQTETAEDVSEAVIATCISRGILYPDLEDDPEDELRAAQLGEVFALVAAVSAAVADGTIVPSGVRFLDTLDADMEQAWEDFTDSAADPEAAAAAAEMLRSGAAPGPTVNAPVPAGS